MKCAVIAIQILTKSVEILVNPKKWHFKITSNNISNYKKLISYQISKIKVKDKHQCVNSKKMIYSNNPNN